MRRLLGSLALAGGALVSTACASTFSTSSPSQAQPASIAVPRPSATILRQSNLGPRPHAWLNTGSHPGSLVYVAAGNQVAVFPENGFNPAQIGAITDGVSGAYGLFVDGKRDLFVANSKTITAYHPGSLSPYVVYKDPASPLYVVKDHAGRLYAANRNGTVTEYLPGHTNAGRVLGTPGVEADGINVDDASNVYVAYRDADGMGSIKEFRPNSRNGHILGMQLTQPQALQLDHSGNIIVVETGGKQVVDIFPPGSTSPSQVIKADYGVTQVVLRAAEENMYVSNFQNGDVYISHYPPGEFQSKIETGLHGVQGMALSNEER